MDSISQKPVILIITFGTTTAAGLQDLENVDQLVTTRYPDHEVRWVFGGTPVRKKLISSGYTIVFERHVPVKNLEEMYADLRKEGKRNIAVQFLFTLTGSEGMDGPVVDINTDDLNIEYGYPLLRPPDNIARTAEALAPRFGDKDTVTIICSHGNGYVPSLNIPLIQLDRYLRKHYPSVFLTTLEGLPGTEAAFTDARKSGLPKAKFIPILFTAGGRLVRDIMSDAPTSYKSQLGLETSSESEPGLGSDPAVMSIWMESIDWTLAKFS